MELGNLPKVKQFVSNWGRIGAHSLCPLSHTAFSLGKNQISARRHILACFQLSSERGEALGLPAIIMTTWSPPVCFLIYLLGSAT